ncbi:MAG: AzlC family ABC transporter permease [Venatoribacter sp.]
MQKHNDFWLGVLHIIPLCLAVLPWGLLAGSMAVSTGLTPAQGVAMSAFIFAGAAQLVTISMLAAGSGLLAITVTIFIITAQHFLYALVLRERVSHLPFKQRLPIGFLLTDELFALAVGKNKYSFAYLMGAGLIFYLSWLLFTLAGVVLAANIPNLESYHLDFSIIATFVAIVVPMIKKLSTLVGVLLSLLLSLGFTLLQLEGAVVLAGLLGMAGALATAKACKEPH